MEQWAEIRRKVLTGQISKRAACKEYDIHRDTLEKMLAHSEPPGYRRTRSRTSKLDPFLPVIQQILKADKSSHRKQRHTSKKIFERLKDEHGYTGGQTLVAMAVRELKQKSREVFLPLSHPPGEAQVDFGCRCLPERSSHQGRPVRHDAALFGCNLHPGVPQRVHRIISGRTCASV